MNILPFGQVYYDKRDHVMKAKDSSRPDDFIEISGSKMRKLAASGATPCDVSGGKAIPSDLIAENCIPPGFMVQSGWEIVSDYYQNVDDVDRWVPYSIQLVEPLVHSKNTKTVGTYGTRHFKLFYTPSSSSSSKSSSASKSSKTAAGATGAASSSSSSSSSVSSFSGSAASPWHSIELMNSEGDYQMIVEIPMFSTAKMEMNKEEPHNPIMQDLNKDGSVRYYTYGVPFFNYGFLPKTWEDDEHTDDETGAKGDGDPIDVIEIGKTPLAMGAIVPVKVLGSLELIDEGMSLSYVFVIRSFVLLSLSFLLVPLLLSSSCLLIR
jgi:3'-phosphoadenosine 5'-phosphosulfate synthase